jgi:hypothetical protein
MRRAAGSPIRALLLAPLLLTGSAEELFIAPACEEELFVFRSLKYGEFDYCRLHLRYRPGTADCLRIVAPTCNVLSPGQPPRTFSGRADWVLTGRAERIICPPGPPPPTCPAGFPAGPIPRP